MEFQDILQENTDFSFKPENRDRQTPPRKAKSKGISFKPENDASIQPAIAELEKVYMAMAAIFGNLVGLPMPRIVIQSQGRKKHTLGWFSPRRWAEMNLERALVHEVTICAEELRRSLMETCGTLLHEMVHVSNWYAQIRDVGRDGRYHNAKFKQKAEDVGLIVEKDMRLGWALTKVGPELERRVSGLNVNENAFAVFRIGMPEREKQPTKNKLMECPCGFKIRSANPHVLTDLAPVCPQCGQSYVLQE